MANLKKLL
jgi:hypothetical protein